MKPRFSRYWPAILGSYIALTLGGHAAIQWWDTNGATTGSGNADGTWDGATANWTTDSAGASAPGTWVPGNTAEFAAGTDFTGTRIVTVSGTQSLAGIIVDSEVTNLTLTGGTLDFGATQGSIDTSAWGTANSKTFTINSVITGTGGLTIASNGNMSATGGGNSSITKLGGTNTFTGNVTITSGLVAYGSDAAFGNAANVIVLNGGGLLDANLSLTVAHAIQVQSGGGTFRLYGSSNATFSGAISGTGNINRTDGGTLNLTGSLSGYSGTYDNQGGITVVNGTNAAGGNWKLSAGTLRIGANGLAAAGSLTLNGGTLSSNAATTGGDRTLGNATTIGGNITLGDATNTGILTFTNTVDLGGATRTLTTASDAKMSGVISNGGITKAGAGTLTINNTTAANTLAGDLTVNAGILSLGTGGTGSNTARVDGFGTGTVNINTGGSVRLWIQNSTSFTVANNFSINGGTLYSEDGIYNLTGTVVVGSSGASFGSKYTGKNLTLSGAITGTGPVGIVAMAGGNNANLVTLAGSNTYSGATTVNAGMTLGLDYTTNDNSKLSDTAALTLSAATVNLTGGTHAEAVGSTSLTAGTVNTISRGSGTATLQLGNITRGAGSILNLSTSGIAGTTTANDAGGVLGVWATVGGTDLATSSGGSIVTYTGYTNVATAGAIADAVTSNVALTGTAASTVTLGAATTNINTLTQSNTGTTTVDAGKQTLRLGPAGGILAGTGKGALNIGIGPLSGKLTTGGSNNTAGTLTVNNAVTTTLNLQVVDNGTGVVGLEKIGTGTLVLSGNNTFSGGILLAAGSLQVGTGGGNGSLGTGAVVNNGAITFNRINTAVVANVISGTGSLTQAGIGTTVLTGANAYTGTTTVNAGVLQVGNGGTTGALGTGAITVGANGILSFNRSDTATLGTNLTGSTGTLRMDGTGTLNITAGATVLPTNLTINSGTVNVSGGGFNVDRMQGNGQIIINSGGSLVIVAGNAHALGSGGATMSEAITINGGTMTFNQEQYIQTLTMSGGTINGSNEVRSVSGTTAFLVAGSSAATVSARFNQVGAANWTVTDATNSSAADLLISGQLTGSGAFVKNGLGTVTLSGASNSASGATTIIGGGLILDYSTNNNTKLADAAALNLNGAVVNLSGGSHTEAVGSTAIGAGASSIVQTGGSSKLQMGAISRSAGGTVDFGAAGIATTTSNNDATGILGGYATVGGGTNLAAKDGSGNVIAYTGYADVALGGAIADGSGTNVRLIGGTSGNVTLGAATTTVNTITHAQTSTTTIDTTSGVLRLGAVGSVNVGTGLGALTIGTTADAGTLTAGGADNNAGELILNAAGNAITVNSTITNNGSGAVTLTKSGAGTVTLNGTNTYGGGTNLAAGTLSLGSAQALGTAGTIAFNGGTLQFTATNTSDYSARFSTAANQFYNLDTNGQAVTLATALTSSGGVLTKSGAGTLTLTGVSTYAGGTYVSNGTLALSGGANRLASTGFVTLGNGVNSGKLALGGTSQTVGGLTALGTGTANAVVGGNATASTLTISHATLNSSYAGALGGAGTNENNLAVTKTGNASFTLTGAGTYTGLTTISGGTFALGSGGSLSGTTGIVVNSGSTFTNSGTITLTGTGGSDDAGSAVTLAVKGSGVFNQTGGAISIAAFGANGVTNISGGTMAVSGNFYVGEQTTNPGIINQTGGTVTLTTTTADAIRIGHWNNANGGTYNLTGGTLDASTSTSNVNIGWDGRGEMTVGGGAGTATFKARGVRLDQGSSNGYSDTLTVSNNGVVELGANGITSATTNDFVNLNGGTVRAVASSTWSSAMVTNTGTTSVVDVNTGVTATITGLISGAGALSKTGAGDIVVSGVNTYSGGTQISGGSIRLADAGSVSALGTGSLTFTANATLANGTSASATVKSIANNITINSGVTASFDGGWKDLTLAGVISGSGNFSQASTGLVILGNDNTYTGTTTTTSSSTLQIGTGGTTGTLGGGAVSLASGSTLKFNRSNSYTVTNAISGSGSVNQAGTGTTLLIGSNNYGATTISVGVLQVGNGGTTGTLGTANVTNNAALAFNRSNALTIANVISGTGSVTQLGTGTTTLTGVNTYTGTTTVSGGTLRINGNSSAATGAVSVASGATFGGTGRIGGAVNVTGTLAPGASVESLATGAVTFNTGSTFAIELDSSVAASSGSDLLVANGDLALSGVVNLTLTDLATLAPTAPFADGTVFSLVNYTGTWNGGFFTYAGDTLTEGEQFHALNNDWVINYQNTTPGQNFTGDYLPGQFVTLTAVPEPGAALIGGLGALLMFRRRRMA